jgi:chaperonin cofactor prefoldin
MELDFSSMTAEEIQHHFNDLQKRISAHVSNRNKIEAALSERRRTLRENIEECRKEGFDPDTLGEDIKKKKEVLGTRYNILRADLETAESMLQPLLSEIK